MPRTDTDTKIAARDRAIIFLAARGEPHRDIAARFGMSRSRVTQIVGRQEPGRFTMPSALGPEGMRDWLYIHGIRNPHDLNEGMRVIDRYVTFVMQRRWPELFADQPPIFFPQVPDHPKVEADPELVIRCSQCGQPKTAQGNYYRRSDTKTGWGRKCIACITPSPAVRNDEGRFAREDSVSESQFTNKDTDSALGLTMEDPDGMPELQETGT
jgi:Homeodomain-like domain